MPGKTLVALVGMQHRGCADFVKRLPDGEPLTLIREPTNPHDPNAVQVWAREHHVGYIKGTQVRPVAMAMDTGRVQADRVLESGGGVVRSMEASLSTRNGERWPMVEIDL